MPPFILNVPNSITIARLLMIPLSALPLLPMFGEITFNKLLVVNIAFILASVTDFLDGYFARKLNQMTEWGAYMDPLIDKYLIWVLFFVFILIPELSVGWWTFALILIRDIAVTQMRNYALKHQISFKTSFLAKCKTATQMVSGALILVFLLVTYILNDNLDIPHQNYYEYWKGTNYYVLPSLLVNIVAIFTFITGLDYAKTLYHNVVKK